MTKEKNEGAQQAEAPKPYVFTNLEDLVFHTAVIISTKKDYRPDLKKGNWHIREDDFTNYAGKFFEVVNDEGQNLFRTELKEVSKEDINTTINKLIDKKIISKAGGIIIPNAKGWNAKIKKSSKVVNKTKIDDKIIADFTRKLQDKMFNEKINSRF